MSEHISRDDLMLQKYRLMSIYESFLFDVNTLFGHLKIYLFCDVLSYERVQNDPVKCLVCMLTKTQKKITCDKPAHCEK